MNKENIHIHQIIIPTIGIYSKYLIKDFPNTYKNAHQSIFIVIKKGKI